MPARQFPLPLFAIACAAATAHAQTTSAPVAPNAGPALTIYNQNFAVVRETVPLNLTAGQSRVTFDGITAHLEPDSVILRDPTGKRDLRVLEQNYEADPLSQNSLLRRFEGKTIDFAITQPTGGERIVSGKIIRSGGAPSYNYNQYGYNNGGQEQPIVEVEGKLRFGLPGTPLFPQLAGDEILKPTLTWNLFADKAGALNAELAYVTSSMSWEAAYNVVSPAQGDTLSLTGWVTMTNGSGIDFPGVHVKLMAGMPNKVQPNQFSQFQSSGFAAAANADAASFPSVTEQAFDEYHLYTLPLPTTLKNGETKQVEFARGDGVASKRLYIYDGSKIEDRYRNYSEYDLRQQRDYGTSSNPRVWTMREFVNSKENHLGIPLPKGKVRFYRQGDGGALEFVGENVINHTPQGETIRVYTGDAFDLVGERRQTDFKYTNSGREQSVDESFEIHVRNRKKEPIAVQIVEHLYRGVNWTIVTPTTPFTKRDSRTIEFPVTIAPNGEQIVKYTAHYSW